MDSRNVGRREFIKKLGVGALATGGLLTAGPIIASTPDMELPDPYPELPTQKPVIPPYKEQTLFFNEHQYVMVASMAAIFIPSDGDPGATEAGVVDSIDRGITSSEKRQTAYTKGLKWMDEISREKYGNDFVMLEIKEQIKLLRRIDESATLRKRPVFSFMERVNKKVGKIWDDQFGIGKNSYFFKIIYNDVLIAFYSNPISWQAIGYFGPPQPVGYLDFSQPPSSNNYRGSVRHVRSESCLICHNEGKKHPRGKLIDYSCNTCHRPHAPWPRKRDAFYLEDYVELIFTSPDQQ